LNIRLQDDILRVIIVKRKVIRISFVFEDQVVEYNTCLHYYPQFSFMHVLSRAMDDGES